MAPILFNTCTIQVGSITIHCFSLYFLEFFLVSCVLIDNFCSKYILSWIWRSLFCNVTCRYITYNYYICYCYIYYRGLFFSSLCRMEFEWGRLDSQNWKYFRRVSEYLKLLFKCQWTPPFDKRVNKHFVLSYKTSLISTLNMH